MVRACVKNGILATDMGRHGAIINGFKEAILDLKDETKDLRAADFFIPGEKGWLMLGMLLKVRFSKMMEFLLTHDGNSTNI